MKSTPVALSFDDVAFAYRGSNVEVLSEISFRMGVGVTGLVGLNGAGKSTLLQVVTGTIRPDSGSISVLGMGGTNHAERREINRRIGYMPQGSQPPLGYSVERFMRYLAWLKGIPRTSAGGEISAALDVVGMNSSRSKSLRTLSGGQWRRTLLAQAILGSPDLLILDEPTVALDPKQRQMIRRVIGDQGDRRAVLLASHELSEVEALADNILILEGGVLRFDGSVGELLEREGTAYPSVEAAFNALIEHE